jgi:hypothetical protein
LVTKSKSPYCDEVQCIAVQYSAVQYSTEQ